MKSLEDEKKKLLEEAYHSQPSLWAEHYLKTESGLPIDFKKRKYLEDIYNDLSPFQVLLKPPQIGATVLNIVKSFWVARYLHKDIIYTLPTQSDVWDMAGGKINRLIAQSAELQELVKDHDTVEQKQVGNNIIYYRGTFSAKQAMMVSSGLNIHDEVDASSSEIITNYETRLQAQEDGGWRWYFSHPSLAGAGVDIYWQQSDKKEWYITCNECKEDQILSWPDSVDKEREQYICRACKRILTDEERIMGEWRATAVGDFSGYHVSQLMLYNKTAKDILDSFNDPQKNEQFFYNYVLGLPYIGGDDSITPQTVLDCVKDTLNSQEDRVFIGVDTGLPIYYVLMNKEGVFHYNACQPPSATHSPYEELESFLKHWPKSIMVADQGGDLIGIRELQAKYPGRVFLCFYNKDRKVREFAQWGDKEEYGKVRVDRNHTMQLMIEQIKEKRIVFNGKSDEWKMFASHFGNLYRERIIAKEAQGKDDRTLYGNEYVWKRRGPDHLAHSLNYALIGYDRFASRPEITVGNTELWPGLKVGRIVT